MSVKIFLIRHGMTDWNQEGRYQGDTDIKLNETGITQARLAAKYLSKVRFSSIYSSPLKRTLMTADIINEKRGLDIRAKGGLEEVSFGKWEGMKFSEINSAYHDDYHKWLEDPYSNRPTGGESFAELTARTVPAVEEIVAESIDGSSIAVVTHGGVILSLLVHWLKIPMERWRSVIQRHAAINIVVVNDGFPYIAGINYTGHLAPVYDENEDRVIEIYTNLQNNMNRGVENE